jgi:hypothetical protein
MQLPGSWQTTKNVLPISVATRNFLFIRAHLKKNWLYTLIQNFSKMLHIPNMQKLVKIIPSFNIVSPSFAFLHSSPTSEIFHKPSTFFHQASTFFTKVQLNIFLQYRMLGEKMSKVCEKFQRLVKKCEAW